MLEMIIKGKQKDVYGFLSVLDLYWDEIIPSDEIIQTRVLDKKLTENDLQKAIQKYPDLKIKGLANDMPLYSKSGGGIIVFEYKKKSSYVPDYPWFDMQDFFVRYQNNGLSIVECHSWNDTIKIPSKMDGYDVKALEDECFGKNPCTKEIVLPNSIETIKGNPFKNCRKGIVVTVFEDSCLISRLKRLRTITLKIVEPPQFLYSIDDGEVTLKLYVGNKKDVIIPETIDGYPVTKIGTKCFNSYESLNSAGVRSIWFPDTIHTIEYAAFYYMTNLKKIAHYPKALRRIEYDAFYHTGLSEFHITENVEYLGHSCIDCEKIYFESNQLNFTSFLDACLYKSMGRYTGFFKKHEIIVGDNVKSVTIEKDMVLMNDGKKLCLYQGEDEVIQIPESIHEVSNYAIYQNVKKIIMNSKVKLHENSISMAYLESIYFTDLDKEIVLPTWRRYSGSLSEYASLKESFDTVTLKKNVFKNNTFDVKGYDESYKKAKQFNKILIAYYRISSDFELDEKTKKKYISYLSKNSHLALLLFIGMKDERAIEYLKSIAFFHKNRLNDYIKECETNKTDYLKPYIMDLPFDEEDDDDFSFDLDEEEVEFEFKEYKDGWSVKKYTGSDEEIVIPAYYQDKKVIRIEDRFLKLNSSSTSVIDLEKVRSVIISEGIEEIGVEAFASAYITSISIPSSLKRIESLGFNHLNLKKELDFSKCKLLVLEQSAICACVMPKMSLYYNAFFHKNAIDSCLINDVEIYGNAEKLGNLFNWASIGTLTLHDTTVVSADLFDRKGRGWTKGRTKLVLNNVNKITGNMKKLMNGLKEFKSFEIKGKESAYWTDGHCLFKEDKCLFLYNETNGKYAVPMGVKMIYPQAFLKARLVELTLPEGLEFIGDGAFRENPFTTLNLPDSVKIIGTSAFMNCKNLSVLNLSGFSKLEEIHDYAFYGTKIKGISHSVKTMGMNVFSTERTIIQVEGI